MKVLLEIIKWEEAPQKEKSNTYPVNHAHVEYKLTGDLTGKAFVEYDLDYVVKDGHQSSAIVSGLLVFIGEYNGKKGTIVATETGSYKHGILDTLGFIKHATDGLIGLTGHYAYDFDANKKTLSLITDFKNKE